MTFFSDTWRYERVEHGWRRFTFFYNTIADVLALTKGSQF